MVWVNVSHRQYYSLKSLKMFFLLLFFLLFLMWKTDMVLGKQWLFRFGMGPKRSENPMQMICIFVEILLKESIGGLHILNLA